MRLFLPLSLLLAMTLAAFGLYPQEPAPLIPRDVPEGVRIALTAGRWDQARAALTEARSARPDDADLWQYLEALSLAREGQRDPALAALERFTAEHPESGLRNKARFLRSELLAGARRFEEAEQLVEALCRELRDPARQSQLALVLVERADELGAEPSPNDPGAQTDPGRALELYARALELEVGAELRRRVLRSAAETAGRAGDPGRAITLWRQLLEDEDLEAPATQSAQLALGSALVQAGQGPAGRRALEDLERELAAAGDSQVLRDARFALAEAWATAGVQQLDSILGAYDRFTREHPGDPRVSAARFAAASWLESAGRGAEASERFEALHASGAQDASDWTVEQRAADAELRTEALYRQAMQLESQGLHAEARAAFESYTARYPSGERWSESQRHIASNARMLGYARRGADDFDGAAEAWLAFLDTWPLDPQAAEVHLDLASLDAMRAEQAAEAGAPAEDLWRSAVASLRTVADKFTGQTVSPQALLRVGNILERELADLEGAVDAYRACQSAGDPGGQASERLGTLLAPSLEIVTERTARTNEAAQLTVRARNHERLSVSIYPLDLEAYFRKHQTHTRIEDLDLDLIAAAQSYDIPFEDYARYLPLETTVELPVEGAGVWAVAISADEQRATTLVLRSDLEVLVKGSAEEALVWAVDALADAPAKDVRILIAGQGSDGATTFVEGRSDADGLTRLRYEGTPESMTVLAVRDGHYAADGLQISGTAAATVRSARGIAYTDRSVYRPGDTVHWRALHRDAEGGALTFRPGDEFRAELMDPSSRVLFRQEAKLNEFGAIDGSFELPGRAPVGGWRLIVRKIGGPSWQCGVDVREYKLQRVELDLEPLRRVWFRGETVEIEARAGFAWGSPMAGALLRYALPDGRQLEARTDDEGLARLSFDSTEYLAPTTLSVRAWLPEENVSAQTDLMLAKQAYQLSVEVAGRAVLAGEGFAATVRAVGVDGEPVETDLEVDILRRVSSAKRRWTETRVETRKARTDAAGNLRLELAFEEGGTYIVRARGTDRFDNPITGENTQFVSGTDDPIHLRLLADQTSAAIGETAAMRAVLRGPAGLALMTFEHATVLEHRLVRLQSGAQPIDFVAAARFAPGVRVSLSRMERGQLHTAELVYEIRGGLVVELVPSSDKLEPGTQAGMKIRVTNAAGQPVETELSIAIVDDALLRAFPDRTPDLEAFFAGGKGVPTGPRTSSSCTFTYAGVTRQISAELLAEAARLEEELKWKDQREDLRSNFAQLDDLGVADAPFDEEVAAESFGGARSRKSMAKRSAAPRPSMTAAPEPPSDPEVVADTLIWLPGVRTGADGTAEITFDVPERSTRWRAIARGSDRGDAFGGAETSFQVAMTLGLELRLPDGIVAGDEPVPGVRIVHPTGGNESAELVWTAVSGAHTQRGRSSCSLGAGGHTDLWLEPLTGFDEALPIEITAELTTASGLSARRTETLDVRAKGLPFAATESGLLAGPRSFELELPGGRTYTGHELRIVLGAGVEGRLIELAMGGRGLGITRRIAPLPAGPAELAGRLLGLCEVLEAARAGGATPPESLQRLESQGDALIAELLVGRTEDGGWGPILGGNRASTPQATARVAWALGRASQVGFQQPGPLADELIARLQEHGRELDRDAYDGRAAVQHALCVLDAADFAALNRLHRGRSGLSPAALAHTALALAERDALPMAAEVAALLEAKAEPKPAPTGELRCGWSVAGNAGWYSSEIEQLALSVLTLQRVMPDSKRVQEGAAALWARAPWYGARGAGIALTAVARTRTAEAPRERRVRLTIAGGTEQVIVLEPGAPSYLETIELPPGSVRVALTPEGGEVPFQLALSATSTDIPDGADRAERLRVWDVAYRPAAPRLAGEQIRVGWGCVEDVRDTWDHKLEHLALGATTDVSLSFRAYGPDGRSENEEPLMLVVPLPAGMGLLEGSFRGGLELVEQQPGRLLVPLGAWRGGGAVQFTLLGQIPGDYAQTPVVLRSLVNPARIAIGDPAALTVLSPGETNPDEYRPTPDELLGMGLAQARAGDTAGAWSSLIQLYDTWGDQLRDGPLKESARSLLSMALQLDDAARVVEMFEILKEKDETYFVPFDEVLAIGAAYRSLGEFERALLIFRATIEETFGADLKVAGALTELGQTARSLSVLESLWRSFPDTPQVIDAYLALSDQLLAAAPGAARDQSLVDAGWNRGDLTRAALTHQRRFLALYPQDPRAPEAALAMVGAFLELEDFERTASLSGEFAGVFAKPRHADSFAYTQAVAQWYLGEEDRALAQLERIAAAEYAGDGGARVPSENRDLALYILGQIHHARRDSDRAEEYYERVDEIFSDAAEALVSLRERRLELAELTTISPGKPAEVEITWRNVEEATILVYSVDLMTLYLREKDLSRVASVNLAGIAPTLETTVELGGGRDLRERTKQTALALPGPGAYLVLARAGETFASGLVLVSDLELDVVEDVRSGRVRVEAQSRDGSGFLRGVDVRVVGSAGGEVTLGQTDPRGLFVADGVIGRATVIARLGDDQYAFHRGEVALAEEPSGTTQSVQFGRDKNSYLQNVLESNQLQIQQRALNFSNELSRDRKGVQVQQVK